MKNGFTLLFVLVISFVFPSLAGTDPFAIPSFSDTSKTIPAVGNSFILPVTNTTLKQITVPPGALEKGQVLLRRRFSANEYGLYTGIMNPVAYGKLSAFKPSENLTVTDFIKRKIYSSQVSNPDMDMENVYFDGELIYVENIAKVFYFDQEWKEIKMLDVLPCRLNITSEPPGASVYIDNEYQGVTPLYLGAVYQPSAIVRLDMKGYFIAENFIDLQNGVLTEKKFELKKKPVFDDGSEIDLEAYTAENTESVLEINQRIESVHAGAAKILQDSTNALNAFIGNYPAMPPKDQFETTEEFIKRQDEFTKKFNTEKNELSRQYNEKRGRILEIIPRMEAYMDSIKEREYTKYFDGKSLELSAYNADSGYFPVKMTINEKEFAFSFKGSLLIPRDQAKDFYAKGTESGKIVLTYKNWQVNIQRDTTKESYYVYFTAFKLRFKEVNYDLQGTCGYPDYIENSPEYGKFLKALDTNREKERIARDARGTIAVKVMPPDVKAAVFIDTIKIGLAPINYLLRPGKYQLSLKADNYKPVNDSLVIVKDSISQKTFSLEHTQQFLDSLSNLKVQAHKKSRMVRRIAFASCAIVSGAAGYWYELQTKKSLNKYNGLGKTDSQNNFNTAWNNYEKYSKRRNICYVVCGISLGGFIISIPF